MKRIFCALCALIVCIFCGGCTRTETAEHMFFAMDTLITLRLPADASAESFAAAEKVIADIERSLSRTIPESDTSRMNQSESGIADVGKDFLAVTEAALRIAASTGGAFSPAVGALTDLWNVNSGGPIPSPEKIAEAMAHADFRVFAADGTAVSKSDRETQLDFGAVGKGYAAQQLVEFLEKQYSWGLVSLGGNVGVFGEKPDGSPFKIGITDPTDTSRTRGYLLIGSGYVSVSGDYERYFEENGVRYHHIIDPETGYPADSGLSSAAVWAQDGAAADALSTALFVMGAEAALDYYGKHPGEFEAVLITKENEIILTPGLVSGENFFPAQ